MSSCVALSRAQPWPGYGFYCVSSAVMSHDCRRHVLPLSPVHYPKGTGGCPIWLVCSFENMQRRPFSMLYYLSPCVVLHRERVWNFGSIEKLGVIPDRFACQSRHGLRLRSLPFRGEFTWFYIFGPGVIYCIISPLSQ